MLPIDLLRARVRGAVLLPADAGYAAEVAAFNTAATPSPDAVVAALDEPDVVEAVRFATEHRLLVSVQTAGHGSYGVVRSGLLISMRALAEVRVDGTTRVASIQGGARWSAVMAAAAEHGLAPIAGSSPDVGVAGLLVGGGLGPLSRSHGFGSDYVLGFRVVTGAGELLDVNATSHPDLFWALRGGKSGLGIVTHVALQLVELPTLYGGALLFDTPHIATVVRAWADWAQTASALVTTSIAIIRFPALDVVPPPLRGRHLVAVRFAYPGASAEGARLAAPLRAWAPLYLDDLSELPAAEIQRIHNDPREPAPTWVGALTLDGFDRTSAEVLLRYAAIGGPSPFLALEVRQLGEATHRDVPGGSAVGGRGARFALGVFSRNVALFETEVPRAMAELAHDLEAYRSRENNIHFIAPVHSNEQLATAWSASTFARLAQVRRRYDPQSVLAHGFAT